MVGLVVTFFASPAFASFPGANGRIAYTLNSQSFPHLSQSIHTVSWEGGDDRALAPGYDPAWSANGSRIAFIRAGDIFTMRADGIDQRRLTNTGATESDPSYSPNGRRIVFTRTVGDGGQGGSRSSIVSVRSADGSDPRVLAKNKQTTDATPGAERPEYDPDGRRIVFFAAMWGLSPQGIYTMRPDGSHKKLLLSLSNSNWAHISLDYSPDGTHIVFQRVVRRWGIVGTEVMRSDGSHRKPVPCPNLDGVAYSPDGGRFVAGEGGRITTFEADIASFPGLILGHCGIPATTGPGYAVDPSWQPLPSG